MNGSDWSKSTKKLWNRKYSFNAYQLYLVLRMPNLFNIFTATLKHTNKRYMVIEQVK